MLGDPWAGGRILALMRCNAFLSYSRSDGAYQMTKLFRSFLRKKAEQDGVDPAPIWRRMGRWKRWSMCACPFLVCSGIPSGKIPFTRILALRMAGRCFPFSKRYARCSAGHYKLQAEVPSRDFLFLRLLSRK